MSLVVGVTIGAGFEIQAQLLNSLKNSTRTLVLFRIIRQN
jgi:hypothetical protein